MLPHRLRPLLPLSSLKPFLSALAPSFLVALAAASPAHAWTPCTEAGSGWCLERRISGDAPGGELGFRFGSPLDADGDGTADIAAGSRFKLVLGTYQNGKAAVWSGKTGTKLHEWEGQLKAALFGHFVLPVHDLDGDRLADVVVSAPSAVIEDRMHGVVSAWSPKSGEVLWRMIAKREEILGWHMAPAGDHDGDAVVDIFVGAPCNKGGRVYLVSGKDGSVLRTFKPPRVRNSFGWYLAETDDLDGDREHDLVVGNLQGNDGAGDPLSEVFLLSSGTGEVLHQWKEEDRSRAFGEVVTGIGDLDEDRRGEIAIGSPRTSVARDDLAGDVQVFSSKTGKELRRWSGKQGGERYGRMVASAGDINGDGVDDVAIGAPHYRDGARDYVGRVEVRSGRSGDVLVEWIGEQAESWFGWHIRKAPDPGGLGRPALLIGSLRQSVDGVVGTGVVDWVVLKK
jgi:hypothetical protein